MATDPNTGPLLILLAFALAPASGRERPGREVRGDDTVVDLHHYLPEYVERPILVRSGPEG
jgi:hypothetical protein